MFYGDSVTYCTRINGWLADANFERLVGVVGVCVVTRLIKPAAVVLPAAISPGDGAGGGGFGSAGAGAGGVGGWAQGLCLRTGPGPSFTGAAGAGGH